MADDQEIRRIRDKARRLGLPVGGDEPLLLDCPECGETAFQFRPDDLEFVCGNCAERAGGLAHLASLAEGTRAPAAATGEALRPDAGRTSDALVSAPPRRDAQAGRVDQGERPRPPGDAVAGAQRPAFGEALIISLLSLVFLGAGLLAAAMSGFANFQAFGAMVEDPLQSRVWAWTGIIASLCSFGGFTFVYWHWSHGRRREGLRAVLFAFAGAATSLVGTQMYMTNTERARLAGAEAAAARSQVISQQVEDWRRQLSAIPPNVRSVEGLEAYIAEVERVGRTHQKPYRDARNELGLARRRADLESRIAEARSELMQLGAQTAARPPRPAMLSWFFASMLEIFSSQGTSIGFVALMILAGRRRTGPDRAAGPPA